jgi:D-sedoheptulose 7-phosphate isomerase
MSHFEDYFNEVTLIANSIDLKKIDELANALNLLREQNGRLFFLGVGGSAGNCSHAVNDFRKLCNIEAYAPTDNVSELTARANDEGWETIFSEWLKVSRANSKDAIFVFSVGGGNLQKKVSLNIVRGLEEAQLRGLKIYGIVGPDGGYTKEVGNIVVCIPQVNENRITPHSEAFQAVIWHGLVSHPLLQQKKTKW